MSCRFVDLRWGWGWGGGVFDADMDAWREERGRSTIMSTVWSSLLSLGAGYFVLRSYSVVHMYAYTMHTHIHTQAEEKLY